MSNVSRELRERISDQIQGLELDSPFRLTAEGLVFLETGHPTPTVCHHPTEDYTIDNDWDVLTGLTGQYGYSGACLHPSEVMGPGVVQVMLDTVEAHGTEALIFVLTEMRDEDASHPEDPIGWTIAHTLTP